MKEATTFDKFVILWNNFKPQLIKYLKGEAVKLALQKLLGSALAGGFRGWLIKYAVEYLFEEVAEPIAKLTLRNVGYVYHRVEGKVILKKIQKAKEEGDGEDYDSAVDDLYS